MVLRNNVLTDRCHHYAYRGHHYLKGERYKLQLSIRNQVGGCVTVTHPEMDLASRFGGVVTREITQK